ncbi:MAG TPA: ATP-binding protein [Candidatus Acidoferrum sp.]|nr:ATP-binding protein [Candidatus Acidoferrum sp.]
MTFPFRSLRTRLLVGTVFVIVLVMTAVVAMVEHRQRAAIIGEVERRGESLAQSLATMSYGPLLLYNFTALEQNATRVAAGADVVYAVILDAEGRVAAHSRHPELVSQPLESAVDRRAAAAAAPLTQATVFGEHREAIYDFAVPVQIDRQKWGTVRVGLSKRRMEAEIWQTRRELSALTVLILAVGGLVAAVVAGRIVRPVRQLAEGADAVSRGELEQRIEPSTIDEIGRLAEAFNHMTAQLLHQRTALEDANTELSRRFRELADLKSYTDSILSSLTTAVVTIDLEGRVVMLNPAAELLTGFFAGEAVTRYCTEVFASTGEIADVLMETLTSHSPIAGIALTLTRRNGVTIPIELSTAPLKGSDGKDLGVVGVFRDLSAVRALEDRLQRSDRLAALGTLAAALGHEIKNPLTSILTFSRHLSRRYADEGFREKFQKVVPRELERINEIVERLMELARPPRLHVATVQLPALLDGVLDLYGNEIEAKRTSVTREYARDIPPIQGDENALYRVIVNLVANALEAMAPGGRLILRLAWAEGPRRLGHHRRVQIEIEDTGPGIAARERDQIFNPFYTTKEGGTGLGLAIAHKIVEEHGGTVDVASTPGVGTTFCIVLPVIPDDAPPENRLPG